LLSLLWKVALQTHLSLDPIFAPRANQKIMMIDATVAPKVGFKALLAQSFAMQSYNATA